MDTTHQEDQFDSPAQTIEAILLTAALEDFAQMIQCYADRTRFMFLMRDVDAAETMIRHLAHQEEIAQHTAQQALRLIQDTVYPELVKALWTFRQVEKDVETMCEQLKALA